jgi:hypothetical protein
MEAGNVNTNKTQKPVSIATSAGEKWPKKVKDPTEKIVDSYGDKKLSRAYTSTEPMPNQSLRKALEGSSAYQTSFSAAKSAQNRRQDKPESKQG